MIATELQLLITPGSWIMTDNKKDLPVLFQVTNFLFSPLADELNLLPIEYLLIIVLAKHHGKKGIYPSTNTLAKELRKSPTYVKRIINRLDARGVIFVDRKFGTSHRYYLSFLSTDRSTTVDESTTVDRSTTGSPTGQLQVHNRSTTVDTINTDKQYRKNNTERARKKTRTSLPDYFLPNEKITALLKEVSLKANKTTDQLLTKFKNLQKSKDGMSADWNAEFENFLINERPMGYTGNGSTELKSTVPFYGQPGHPSYEEDKKLKDKLAEQEIKRAKPKFEVVNNEPIVYESFRDAKRRYELSQQGALNNVSQSGNNSGGSDSS